MRASESLGLRDTECGDAREGGRERGEGGSLREEGGREGGRERAREVGFWWWAVVGRGGGGD